MQPKIKASIIGVTGYTGIELLRLLLAHPHAETTYLTARVDQDTPIGNIFPHLAHADLEITNTPHDQIAAESDVVFLALPHKTAQDIVAELHGKTKVIDLSADYRLSDAATYEKYYTQHKHPNLLNEVIYGAPEIVGTDKIAAASSVANPGCFALLAQLMLFPFAGKIKHADIVAITGSSGSGKTASVGTHHPIRSHNMKSYNINAHRHIPEITRTAKISEDQLNFVPTSGPFVRGIFAQGFVELKDDTEPDCAAKIYESAPFIRVVEHVALANIVGSNYCDISYQIGHDGRILVQGALDNLVKGASGCAVQNMNIMFGLEETLGLDTLTPVYP